MDAVVYFVCAAICLLCVVQLFRAYLVSRGRLALGSVFCFGALCANNLLAWIDADVANINDWLRLATARTACACSSWR